MIEAILIAVAVVFGIGILCALGLVIADRYMSVSVDETEGRLRAALPGANCGACGYTGCDGYAKALASGAEAKTNLCIPGADATSREISTILGVAFADVVEQVAVIHCGGDCKETAPRAEYYGPKTCAAASLVYGGAGKCKYGCIGYGDCAAACPNGAICIQNGIALVDTRKCTGCGICTRTCPHHLITLMADVERVLVTCSSNDKGAVTRAACSHGCIGCRKCEKNCPTGAITVSDNLASVDYERCIKCDKCAEGCPTGCIMISDFAGIHRYTVTEKETVTL